MILGGAGRSGAGLGGPRPAGTPGISHMTGDRFRVYCTTHGLDRTVDTQDHATNLWALHLRRDHADEALAPGAPATVDLSAAAALVTIITADPLMSDLAKTTARNVWACLTGLSGDDALAYARAVAATHTTAVIPPF